MAREYARYLTMTHRDDDWCALSTVHHDCYMALLSSDDISWAGVVPYLPSRYARLASDLTERKVIKVWDELAEHDMIVIDKGTAEILVRTFLKHDNVLSKPNLTKAFITAHTKVHSPKLLKAIDYELAKLLETHPTMSGWGKPFQALSQEQFDEQFGEPFTELFLEQFGELQGEQ